MGVKKLTKLKIGKVRWLISITILTSLLSSIAGLWSASQKTNVNQNINLQLPSKGLNLSFKSLGGNTIIESFDFDYNYFVNNENSFFLNLQDDGGHFEIYHQ